MLPITNFDPPFAITRASHVSLAVTDLETSRDFYRDVIGLVVTEETDDTVYLRGLEESAHHSLVLERGPEAKAHRVGLRVRTDADILAAEKHFAATGVPHERVEKPLPGSHAAVPRPGGHAHGAHLLDGPRPAQDAGVPRVRRRRSTAARPLPGRHLRRAGGDRFLDRPRDADVGVHRDGRHRRTLGHVDGGQGQHPRPRLHERQGPAAAPLRVHGARCHRPDPRGRRRRSLGFGEEIDRGPGRHGIRTRCSSICATPTSTASSSSRRITSSSTSKSSRSAGT